MNRTYYFLFSFFLLSLYSCKEDTVFDNPYSDNAITFKVIPYETSSKGTPIDFSNNLSEINVYAYYTGSGDDTWSVTGSVTKPEFIDNLTVTNKGEGTGTDNWQYDYPLYWPSDDTANITFWAYYPSATGTGNSGNGIEIESTTGGITLNYTVPTECADQPDLMLAVPIKDLNKTHKGAVAFEMKHALISIGFTAAEIGRAHV